MRVPTQFSERFKWEESFFWLVKTGGRIIFSFSDKEIPAGRQRRSSTLQRIKICILSGNRLTSHGIFTDIQ